jgi:hypothetical protein
MKASELRLNNIIGWHDGNKNDFLAVRVKGVLDMFITSEVNGTLQHKHENYQSWIPIPLTQEWLLKFGFKKDGIYYENAHLQLSKMTSKNGYDCYCTDLDFSIFMTELEHVHSLQNLYFALTGEELTTHHE